MLVDNNGREITAGCKVMWDNTLCDIDWIGESHRKELQEFCAKHIEVVDVDDIGGGCGQLWFVQKWIKQHAVGEAEVVEEAEALEKYGKSQDRKDLEERIKGRSKNGTV